MQAYACLKPGYLLHALSLAEIRRANIAACLEAMIDERRFMYTDLFIIRK